LTRFNFHPKITTVTDSSNRFQGYIFETKLIETLIFKFLNVPMFRNVTLKCLTEIAAVSVTHYDEIFVSLFTQTMSQLQLMLPAETNIKEAYANGMDAEQQFIQDLVKPRLRLSTCRKYPIVRRKSVEIARNSDHNIDPWSQFNESVLPIKK
jgi:hypothetical protein